MAIRVMPGATDTICDYADGFVLQVTGAADVEAAARALGRARDDILGLAPEPMAPDDGPLLSNAVLAPGGPLLRIARLDVDEDRLCSIPDLVAERLLQAGIGDARVDVLEPGGPLDDLDACPNAVVLRLFPPTGDDGTLPARWIDIACEWVLGDLAPTDRVPLRLLAVHFEVKVADAPSILHQANLAGAWCDIVNGDLDERVRTASITFGLAPHVALGAGGPACDSGALLARFELLTEVARELAGEAAYACLDVEETFEGMGLGLSGAGWRDRGGGSPNLVVGRLAETLVPDAFPFQVLGPGHIERLRSAHDGPGALALGEPLANGRVAVEIGDRADWLPFYDVRDEVQEEGFELLAPLLVTEAELDALLDAEDRGPVDTGAARGRDGLPAGTPDLDDIVLETVPHARRGLRLTFLELVSWLAHEPHSDAPATVSPVLATYGRWFASALDPERRQELKPRARALIGTRGPTVAPAGRRAHLSPADAARAWLTTDWLIRVQAASWLRLAELGELADRLEAIGPTTGHVDLVKAVDILGSAITTSSRRIELTGSVAGTERPADSELVEHAAWEAWELASEKAGWVAASEAAGVGVPDELAYTTDLRVIECARDPRVREELEAARRSIGDSAWATALHAVADEAWTHGWKAAEAAIDGVAVVPLETALARATRAAATRARLDDDAREDALDAAEAAARELLTRAALGETRVRSGDHPWDAACAAAAGAAGPGGLWATVHELARDAVEDAPWEIGMAAARDAVDEILHDAPNLVARAVGAAVAREAAGTAARAVAMRAAAVARARGADPAGVGDAASEALASTVVTLQDAAFALLDVLIAVE